MSSRRVVLLEHVSLDGFLAGPDGDMSWIRVDDELWDYVGPIIERGDTALYGRVTYAMMAAYWPTAADDPDASAHDIAHGRWTASATKLVFSRTLESAPWGESASATLVRDDVSTTIRRLQQQSGSDMILLGSASLAHSLIRDGLVDEFRINVNPVTVGGGLPLFAKGVSTQVDLKAVRTFASGVVGLHYERALR